MSPQTVNALNLPLQNALNFPAAILAPPYFDPAAPAAANYGAIGAVIGHEITHSFDDQGAMFDAEGRLSNWWTKEDLEHFRAAGKALAAQYDAYAPFPGSPRERHADAQREHRRRGRTRHGATTAGAPRSAAPPRPNWPASPARSSSSSPTLRAG